MLRVQYGRTALIRASINGHAAVVKLLVAAKASLDAVDQVSAGSVLGGRGWRETLVLIMIFNYYDYYDYY